jgi:nitrite reductase/ring-hydroxylating ferredoxin subunit
MTDLAPRAESLVEVVSTELLEEAVPFSTKVRGREIVVIKWHDDVYAIRNICAHQSAMLSHGWIQRELVQGDGFYDVDVNDDSPVVRCPWHAFRFRLRDGTCVGDPNLRIRSYPVTVMDGKVFVDFSPA